MFDAAGRSADHEAARRAAAGDATAVAWVKGAEGERRVAMTLETLESRGVIAIHDRLLRRGGQANIDHIAVGPTGVYVIDAKHYDGHLWVGEHAARANGIDLADVLRGARRQAAYVADALKAAGIDAGWVSPVLCMVGKARPPRRCAPIRGVTIVDAGGLRRLIGTAPSRLDDRQVRRVADAVERSFPQAAAGQTARRPVAAPPRRRPSLPPPRGRPSLPRPAHRSTDAPSPWSARSPVPTTGVPAAIRAAIRIDATVRRWRVWVRVVTWWFAWPVLVAARLVAGQPRSTARRAMAVGVLAVAGPSWFIPSVLSRVT